MADTCTVNNCDNLATVTLSREVAGQIFLKRVCRQCAAPLIEEVGWRIVQS